MSARPLPVAQRSGPAQPSAERALLARLAAPSLPALPFDERTSLPEAALVLQQLTGVNVLVRPAALEAWENEGAAAGVAHARPRSAERALDLLCSLGGEELAWTVRHGVVVIADLEGAAGEPITRVYEVSDLLRRARNVGGRELGVAPSGWEAPEEDDESHAAPLMSEEALLELVRGLDPEAFDRPGSSLHIRNGKLYVTTTPSGRR